MDSTVDAENNVMVRDGNKGSQENSALKRMTLLTNKLINMARNISPQSQVGKTTESTAEICLNEAISSDLQNNQKEDAKPLQDIPEKDPLNSNSESMNETAINVKKYSIFMKNNIYLSKIRTSITCNLYLWSIGILLLIAALVTSLMGFDSVKRDNLELSIPSAIIVLFDTSIALLLWLGYIEANKVILPCITVVISLHMFPSAFMLTSQWRTVMFTDAMVAFNGITTIHLFLLMLFEYFDVIVNRKDSLSSVRNLRYFSTRWALVVSLLVVGVNMESKSVYSSDIHIAMGLGCAFSQFVLIALQQTQCDYTQISIIMTECFFISLSSIGMQIKHTFAVPATDMSHFDLYTYHYGITVCCLWVAIVTLAHVSRIVH